MASISLWTRTEWKYCLECFAKSESVEDAIRLFRRRYSRRTEDAVLSKFRSENLGAPTKYLKSSHKIDVDLHLSEIRDEQKQKAIEKAEKQELSELRKRKFMIDIIIEEIRDQLIALPEPTKVSAPKTKSDKGIAEELMFPVSDVQIGEFVEPKDVGGLGGYSMATFEERVSLWRDSVINMIKNRIDKYDIKKIHIPFHGDIVEGMGIYSSQAFHLETGLVRQTVQGTSVFSKAIAAISEAFGNSIEIEIDHVGGNHGRIGRKGETPYQDNWDRLFGFMLGSSLEKYKNISNNIPEVWFIQKEILGWKFHIEHGDDVQSWMSLPAYGMLRAHGRNTLMWNSPIHFYLIGHHHVGSQLQNGYGEVLCNGNWVGANEFSAKTIKAHSRPFQFMFAIREDNGIVERHMCYFEDIKTSLAKMKRFASNRKRS